MAVQTYHLAMPHPHRARRQPPDVAILADWLQSPDEELRIRALHGVCPCAAGFRIYEQFRADVKRLQKDPSERVRAVALHVDADARRLEALEANLDRAEGQGRRLADPDQVRKWKQRQATRYWLPL